MKAKSIALSISLLFVLVTFERVQAQIILEISNRFSQARVLINDCVDEWETQIQTSDSTGPVDQDVLAGLSGKALSSQNSDLQVTDSTITASGIATASSEYLDECFLPSQGWERHFCIAEYQIIFRVESEASYAYSCDLSTAGGSNKFLLNEYPGGTILVNEYGNVGSSGTGTLVAGKTYQLYVNASVNLCWGCPHYDTGSFDFSFTAFLHEAPVSVESRSWSVIKAMYQ